MLLDFSPSLETHTYTFMYPHTLSRTWMHTHTQSHMHTHKHTQQRPCKQQTCIRRQRPGTARRPGIRLHRRGVLGWTRSCSSSRDPSSLHSGALLVHSPPPCTFTLSLPLILLSQPSCCCLSLLFCWLHSFSPVPVSVSSMLVNFGAQLCSTASPAWTPAADSQRCASSEGKLPCQLLFPTPEHL